MIGRTLLAATCSLACALIAPARADDAGELLSKARAAAKSTKDLSATIETKVTAEGQVSTLRAALVVAFSDERFPLRAWRFDMPAKEGESGPTPVVAGIGDRIYQLSPATKELVELNLNGLPPMPQEGTFLLPLLWYIGERADGSIFPGMPAAKLVSSSLEGEREVGGVRCRVVRMTRETTLGQAGESMMIRDDATIALGVEDHLPRHIHSKLTQVAGDTSAVQEIETTYTGVRANTSPADSLFRVAVPEGFAHRVESEGPAKPEKGADKVEAARSLAVKAGDPAKPFALTSVAGAERSLADYRGKVLVLDFWASWCGPCKAAMPSLQRLHERYAGKPVAIVGVNIGERSPTAGTEYLATTSFTYECLLAGDELARAYGVKAIPTIVVIGPDGSILHAKQGFSEEELPMLERLIEKAIAEPAR